MFGAFLIKRFLFPRELFDDDVMPPSQNLEDLHQIPSEMICTYIYSNPYKERHLVNVQKSGKFIIAYELQTQRFKKFLINGIKVIN